MLDLDEARLHDVGERQATLATLGGDVFLGGLVGVDDVEDDLMSLVSSDKLFKREPEISRSIILTSIGTWFVIDSTASVIAGAPLNALLNCSFLFLYFVPLMRMTKPATA